MAGDRGLVGVVCVFVCFSVGVEVNVDENVRVDVNVVPSIRVTAYASVWFMWEYLRAMTWVPRYVRGCACDSVVAKCRIMEEETKERNSRSSVIID